MTLGEKIKQIREEKRMTQEEFGKSIGLSGRMVREYEKGNFPIPSDKLDNFIKIHKVNPTWLFLDDGEPFYTQEASKNFLSFMKNKNELSETDELELEQIFNTLLDNDLKRKAILKLLSINNNEVFKDLSEIYADLSVK